MNSKLVIVLSALTVGVGAVVFGYYTTQAMKIDRSQFQQAKLRVASYPAFISSYGPGPELAKRFKEKTGFEVELINGGDPSLIVSRLKGDPKLRLDVVVGIDQLLSSRAKELDWKRVPGKLLSLVKPELRVFEDPYFLPIDWSPLTFIYRSKTEPPLPRSYTRLGEFLEQGKKEESLVLEDPRSSVLGQQWLYWFDQQKVPANSLASRQPRLANSWSQAYGLFKRKSADLVFSYLTSVVFHWGQEKDRSYQFVQFESGHPFQVDAAGVLGRCQQCSVGLQFLEFLMEPESQILIMKKNYMLPSRRDVEITGLFSELPKLKLVSYKNRAEFDKVHVETQQRYLNSLK